MKDEVRKYLSYAIGELLLVTLGIFIALQIDNWNDDRKQQASLHSYLETIARNMREDSNELRRLREQRLRHLEAAVDYSILSGQGQYTMTEISTAVQGIAAARAELFFSANTAGYDALKISAVFSRLQGTGVDDVLSAYYDTVGRIAFLERSHVEYVRAYNIENMQQYAPGMEPFAWSNPSALSSERFAELQPFYRADIQSPGWSALLFPDGRIEALVGLYDSLVTYAQVFSSAIAEDSINAIGIMPETDADRLQAGYGLPGIVVNGQAALESYWLGLAASSGSEAFRVDSFHGSPGEVHLQHFGKAEWVSIYFGLEGPDAATVGRRGLDFSAYSVLELEMKGSLGGETLQVAIKDVDYPDHLPPVSVPVTLDKEWRRYEIALSEFAPNDLSKLNVVLAFNFAPATEPAAFVIRSARYR